MNNKTPPKIQEPSSVEAEESVLSAILIDSDSLVELGTFLKPDDFYIERHGWIYEASLSLYARNRPIDIVSVADELNQRDRLEQVGGESYLIGLLRNIYTPAAHAAYYGHLIERDSIRRKLIASAGKVARLAYEGGEIEEVLAEAEKAIADVSSGRTLQESQAIGSIADEIYSDVEEMHRAGGKKIIGLPTGLIDIDRLIGGLQGGQFLVLAGRPGMGKTSMAMQIPLYLAKRHSKRSLIFSLEMSKKELVRRLISAESRIEEKRIKAAQFSADEWTKYHDALRQISGLPIYIDDGATLTASMLRARIMSHYNKTGLDLVIVDYLQLMDGEGRRNDNRQQEVTEISRACKKIARELNIPVIGLSQLSRKCEERSDKRPILSDLRESGALEQDSDIVIFLYRDEVYNPKAIPDTAEAIIAKHRSGPTGVVPLFYQKRFTYFVNIEVKTQQLGTIS
jgi:replicative DNA helicase